MNTIHVSEEIQLVPPNSAYAEELHAIIIRENERLCEWLPWAHNYGSLEQSIAHTEQTKKNFDASYDSYFEIISEAQMPISNDPLNSLHYTYSITRRTLTPILFGNVFHIMPNSKSFEDELTSVGFQLFFKDNEDFLNNLNEDFYFKEETQFKIKHNHRLLSKIYHNNILNMDLKNIPFYHSMYLEYIYFL